LRRVSIFAAALYIFGCSSHSAIPSPASSLTEPSVSQKQPLANGAWTWVQIPPLEGHVPNPVTITADTHGNIWAADLYPSLVSGVSKITMGQRVTTYALSIAPTDVAGGPDGNVWATSYSSGVIAKVTPNGIETDYSVDPHAGASTTSITAGPDGAMWFTIAGDSANELGRITTTGVSTLYSAPDVEPPDVDGPIITGPDGNLWFGLNHDAPNVYSVTPRGGLAGSYVIPGSAADVIQLASGPDGAVWVAAAAELGRITTAGVVSSFAVPGTAGHVCACGIAAGIDGNMWMTYEDENGPPHGALITFDPTTSLFGSPITSPVGIGKMLLGPDKNFWFGAGNGYQVSTYVNLVMTVSPSSLTIAQPGQTAGLAVSETNYAKRWSATTSSASIATVAPGPKRGTFVVAAVAQGSCAITISDRLSNAVRVKVTVQ
jgi:streptogramin lyase